MNPDPFATFMAHWTPSVGMAEAFALFHMKHGGSAPYVMPDLEPFRSNDGAHIGSRSQWREHLRANNLQELGMADIRRANESAQKRREAFRARLPKDGVKQVEVAQDWRPAEPSRLQREIANRLHDRPAPARKELIKLSLDQAKRMRRG